MTATSVFVAPAAAFVKSAAPSRSSFARPTGCRNCIRRKVTRPRGLCHKCHGDPAVRAAHPSTSKYAARGVANLNAAALPLPAAPTPALPGSDEKLLALVARAAAGLSLWHPRDGLV